MTSITAVPCRSMPLSAIFILQCLLVIGAFVAVILVLTEQQRTEFRDVLYSRLGVQQHKALQQVYAPLEVRSTLYRTYAAHYLRKGLGTAAAPVPDVPTTLAEGFPFYEHFTVLNVEDPLLFAVLLANRSDSSVVPYDPGRRFFSFFLVDNLRYVHGFDGSVDYCLVTPAMPPLTQGPNQTLRGCASLGTVLFDTIAFGTPQSFTLAPQGRHLWNNPSYVFDPLENKHVLQMSFTVQLSKRPVVGLDKMLYFAVNLPDFGAILRRVTLDPFATVALFSDTYTYGRSISTLVHTTIKLPQPNLTVSELNWAGGKTPDAGLNAAYAAAHARCYVVIGSALNLTRVLPSTQITDARSGTFPTYTQLAANPCADAVVLDEGGTLITAARLVTDEYLDLMLVQYTPREHYFGASDRARLQGILIGAGAALVIVVSCVLILAAVWVPLRALQRGMDLAADMRNDEVPALRPVLTEIKQLAGTFAAMNARLLLARPFLPQALLVCHRNKMNVLDPTTRACEQRHSDDGGEGSEGDLSYERTSLSRSGFIAGQVSIVRSSCPSASFSRRSSNGHSAGPNRGSPVAGFSAFPTAGANGSVLADAGVVGAAAVTSRRVAVLAVNARGFHQTVGGSAAAAQSTHRRLAELVEASAAAERGVVDAFHGDRFVVVFNTVRSCGLPAKAAALAALRLGGNARGLVADDGLCAALPLGLSMGLSCGRALVGNMGTATMQRLSTVGAVYSEACALQEVMARGVLGRGGGPVPVAGRCLFGGRVVPELEGCVEFQVVGAVPARRVCGSSTGLGTDGTKRLAAAARAENKPFETHFSLYADEEHRDGGEAATGFDIDLALSGVYYSRTRSQAQISKPPAGDVALPHHVVSAVVVAVLYRAMRGFAGASSCRSCGGEGEEWLYQLQPLEQSQLKTNDAGLCDDETLLRRTNIALVQLFHKRNSGHRQHSPVTTGDAVTGYLKSLLPTTQQEPPSSTARRLEGSTNTTGSFSPGGSTRQQRRSLVLINDAATSAVARESGWGGVPGVAEGEGPLRIGQRLAAYALGGDGGHCDDATLCSRLIFTEN